MKLTRRQLLERGGVGLAALMSPFAMPRRAGAMPADPALVVLFLRGGADGINMVVPRGDEVNYVALRNNPSTGSDITLPPAPASLQLDGFFELHPSLDLLKPLYDAGDLAVVHAVGGTGDYSHFTAMDAMELVSPESPNLVSQGWLNSALGALRQEGRLDGPVLTLSGVSISTLQPKAMVGPEAGVSLATPSLGSFELAGDFSNERGLVLPSTYQLSEDPLMSGQGSSLFPALSTIEQIAGDPPGTYPAGSGSLNRAFQDAARLIKAQIGVRVVTIDFGGWDHHSNENNRLVSRAGSLAAALSGFWADLGAATSRTLVLVMTEFGRTAKVNGNDGTDHGWGSLMLVLHGGVGGGRVLSRADAAAPGTGLVTPSGHWPGLGPGELHVQESSGQERDLKATTDFRDVFGEVLDRFFGLPTAAIGPQVLRGYTPSYPGLFL